MTDGLPFTPDELRLLEHDLQGAVDHYRDKVRRYDGTPVADEDGLRQRRERAERLQHLRAWIARKASEGERDDGA